jgi:predicted CXXCH cytochrome family protein
MLSFDLTGANAVSNWQIETVDSTGSVGASSSIALDTDGYPHISYYDHTNGDLKYAYKDGSGWHIETADNLEATLGCESSIALDTSGYPHIGYCVTTDSLDSYIKYAYKDETGWHTETTGYLGGSISMALDTLNHPHISYFEYNNCDLKYAYKDATGWHTETVDSAGDVGRNTSIALDTYDYPHISYWDYDNRSLKYAYKNDTGWHTETADKPGLTIYVGSNNSIALDASNNPHISYYDESWLKLKYAYKDGAGWHTESVDSVGRTTDTSIALDASNNPHISYYDEINEDLKYAYKDETGWHIETVDSNGNVGTNTSIAVDASGWAHISYYDATNQDLKYAVTVDAPTVWSTDPADGATRVPVGKTITVTFREDIQAGPNYNAINVKDQYGADVPFSKSISNDVLTIAPQGILRYSVTYTVYIPANSVEDLAGNGMADDYTFSFTTWFNWTHGQFSATTDACAGCHVAHAAQMPNLLKQGPTQTHFCFLCHGDGATSAPYDVKDGYTRTAVSGAVYPSTAGGFVYQFVDTNGNYAVDAGELRPVTSRHNVWGFVYGDESGAVQDTPDKYYWIPGGSNGFTGDGFVCTSCHDPHDGGAVPDGGYITGSATNPNPRLLRRSITVQDATYTSLYVKFWGSWEEDENKGSYHVTAYDSRISEWCGACHNKLQTDDAGNKAGEGEAIRYFGMWRHPIGSHVLRGSVTDESLATGTPVLKGLNCGARQVGCLSCHRAHSSAVVMEEGSWAASWPREAADPATGKAQGETSALLRMDNRGTCYNCHGAGQRNCRNDPFYDSFDCSSCHPHTGSGAHPIMGDCNGCHDW